MCPLYPFHVIILYLCLLLPLLFAVIEGSEELSKWNLKFTPGKIDKMQQFNFTEVELTCHNCPLNSQDNDPGALQLKLTNDKANIATLEYEAQGQNDILLNLNDIGFDSDAQDWSLMFNITGHFLGFTHVKAELKDKNGLSLAQQDLSVSVVRKKTIQSKIFSYSVAILVSLAYINMGCAMDLEVVKRTLKKPIGPAIGFICQYLVMPLLSYALGFIFGSSNAEMRLGLFVTGIQKKYLKKS